MRREVESASSDARWRTEIHLSTGSVLVEFTDWKPAHWDEHARARTRELDGARRVSADVDKRYGVKTVRTLQFQESRRTLRVLETYTSESLHSEHLPVVGVDS